MGNRNVACETTIRLLDYHGKKKSFNWYKYKNLHVEQQNIKSTLTSHGFNDWSEAQKVFYLIKGINTSIVDTCPDSISGSAALRDDFGVAAHHVTYFIVIMKSRDPGIYCNILGVVTD